jgi:hypothetical protein
MAGAAERSVVHVEGRDDRNALVHLLIRHGITYDDEPWPLPLPEFREAPGSGGVDELLNAMATAVSFSSGRAVGFVLDADSPLIDRWRAVRGRLGAVDVVTPTDPPADGFIGESSRYGARVGVWLMPDNQHDGKLETFLRELIDQEDVLIGHAQAATEQAHELGAGFAATKKIKAVLHAWLAWQEEPGRKSLAGRAWQAVRDGDPGPVLPARQPHRRCVCGVVQAPVRNQVMPRRHALNRDTRPRLRGRFLV